MVSKFEFSICYSRIIFPLSSDMQYSKDVELNMTTTQGSSIDKTERISNWYMLGICISELLIQLKIVEYLLLLLLSFIIIKIRRYCFWSLYIFNPKHPPKRNVFSFVCANNFRFSHSRPKWSRWERYHLIVTCTIVIVVFGIFTITGSRQRLERRTER